MSDDLSHFLQDNAQAIDPNNISQTDEEEEEYTDSEFEETEEKEPKWLTTIITQPPTPEKVWWSDQEITDSDNESVPSSLDTFLFETFRPVDTQP